MTARPAPRPRRRSPRHAGHGRHGHVDGDVRHEARGYRQNAHAAGAASDGNGGNNYSVTSSQHHGEHYPGLADGVGDHGQQQGLRRHYCRHAEPGRCGVGGVYSGDTVTLDTAEASGTFDTADVGPADGDRVRVEHRRGAGLRLQPDPATTTASITAAPTTGPSNDFDGDGTSDVLLHNQTTERSASGSSATAPSAAARASARPGSGVDGGRRRGLRRRRNVGRVAA